MCVAILQRNCEKKSKASGCKGLPKGDATRKILTWKHILIIYKRWYAYCCYFAGLFCPARGLGMTVQDVTVCKHRFDADFLCFYPALTIFLEATA